MTQTYEYKYVRVRLKGGGFTGKFSESYQHEIDAWAQDGWRFVQAFAPAVVGYGSSAYTDLIFEREVENGVDIKHEGKLKSR